MAKTNIPKGKLVRKFGENIFGNPKFDDLLNKKPYTPGQHGPNRRRRLSNYGIQLKEKQKIKAMYGVLERQFRNYFNEHGGHHDKKSNVFTNCKWDAVFSSKLFT